MADDVRAEEVTPELQKALAEAVGQALEVPGAFAYQCAVLVCDVILSKLAGMRVTYPALPEFDADAVGNDWDSGLSWKQITRKHGISKSTAYKYHPSRRAA